MNRLFEILLLLLEKEKMTTKQLAEHFEVSRRTILRDMDKLLVAGVPIISQAGYEGGISIDKSYQLDIKLITNNERESILHGLKAMDSVSSSPVLPNFMHRLLDNNTMSYNEIMDIDLSSWYGTMLIPKIDIIKQAITEHTKITFQYYASKGTELKKVSPIKISFRWSSWYLVGICNKANEPRFYKLNRMEDIMLTKEKFKSVHINYQHNDYFDNPTYQLVATFHIDVKYRLVDEFGIDSFIEKDNTLYFEKGFVSKEYLLTWLLGFGNKVQVIEPQEIKEELIHTIKMMYKVYECDI